MIKVRILAKYSPLSNTAKIPDAEIFVENTENPKGAVEEIRIVNGSLVKSFVDDWDAFIPRIQFLKTNSPNDPSVDGEILSKLEKKSNSLKSLLFQNGEPFYRKNEKKSSNRILFVTDPEFASLPLEILTCNGNFLYKDHIITRQIRSERFDKNLRKAKLHWRQYQEIIQDYQKGFQITTQEKQSKEIESIGILKKIFWKKRK